VCLLLTGSPLKSKVFYSSAYFCSRFLFWTKLSSTKKIPLFGIATRAPRLRFPRQSAEWKTTFFSEHRSFRVYAEMAWLGQPREVITDVALSHLGKRFLLALSTTSLLTRWRAGMGNSSRIWTAFASYYFLSLFLLLQLEEGFLSFARNYDVIFGHVGSLLRRLSDGLLR